MALPTPATPLASTRPSDTYLFLGLLALLATAIGYHFGFGNQTEALPIIERYRSPGFLRGDFFVETGSGFGPRFYYAKLIALLSGLAPVPYVMLLLTGGVNAAVGGVSYAAAREILRADRATGWLAATLALCSSSFALGLVSDIHFVDFQPGSIAIAWALAGLWQALCGRPLRGAALCAVASAFHPLYGLETGALALASAALRALLMQERPLRAPAALRALVPSALGAAILGAAAVLLWALPSRATSEPPLTLREVLDILARFRAPHHYLPSTFPPAHYAAFAGFVVASALTFRSFWQNERRPADLAFLVAPVAVLLGCLLGYLLVEVHPTQAMTTAQPFRLLYVFKWQGYLLASWLVARLWQQADCSERFLSATTLAGSAAAQPANFLLAALYSALPVRTRLPRVALALAALSLPIALLLGAREELWLLGAAAVLLCSFWVPRSSTLQRGAAVGFTAAVLAALVANHALHFTKARPLTAVVTFDDHVGDDAEVARWVRRNTPGPAVFVIPPGMGSFRLIAERAVVVDYKSLPFGAGAMRTWYQRMQRLYGPVTAGGFPGLRQMDANYARIGDAELTRIGQELGASYAVLYAKTPSERPALYRNATFQVVRL